MTQREVTLEGGVPWGFRMHGGVDSKTPLKVSRVNPGSKAAQRGIREGDIISSINDLSTKKITNNEAHNLLKNAGSTLKLGLNEDIELSPKKKQYRTIHQETHEEFVKRSSISYTLKETIERSSSRNPKNQEFEAFEIISNKQGTKQNGSDVTIVTNIPVSQKSISSSSSSTTSTPSTLVAEGKNITSDQAIASRQSSYSNCSSIPDDGLGTVIAMNNDGDEKMSKSKKRRQRRKNLLNRTLSHDSQVQSEAETDAETESEEIVLEPAQNKLEFLKLKRIEHKYKVESPKEIRINKKLKAKSKSLDDDDLLNIQELSEASENEDIHTNIVISEASSEENLLDDFIAKKPIYLELNDNCQLESTSLISPEDEQALRTFLGGLKLVDSPEESAKDLYERTSGENDSKAKKLQKRLQLEEYFMPIAQNPKYLDAISEEASDISDKECSASSSVRHLKQGTPELNKVESQTVKSNILVEPILVESIVEANEEKAELVYLSTSSSDFDDTADEQQKSYDFQIDSQEAISTNISSEINSSTRISNGILTPPLTPVKDCSTSSKVVFDYTRIPNVLQAREPSVGERIKIGNVEDVRKLDPDEVIENENCEIEKNIEVLSHNIEKLSNENSEQKKENCFEESKHEEDKVDGNASNKNPNNESVAKENNLLINESITRDESVKTTSSSSLTKSIEIIRNESRKESTLKQMIMTSNNKTDSQKLLEFENINMLNTEIKDKIKRQELVGFRKSKSPSVSKTVVMNGNGEELPGKSFVQKRVKEFLNVEENSKYDNEEFNKHDLINSRIKTFSNNEELVSTHGEGSILKKIILGEDTNNNDTITDDKNKEEHIIPIKLEEQSTDAKMPTETIIPIKLESEEKDIKSPKEIIIPIKIEASKDVIVNTTIASKEIPIKIEKEEETIEASSKTSHSSMSTKFSQDIQNINKSLQNIIGKDEPKCNNFANNLKHINESLQNMIQSQPKEENIKTPKERIIPIEINNDSNKIVKNEPPIPPPRKSKAFLLRKTQKDTEIPVSKDITYTNVLSPPRPASASSDSTSCSEESSRCTAKYNPNSSIADVASINEFCDLKQPESLRSIVLKLLISLPFGEEMLKVLAEASSKTIESLIINNNNLFKDKMPQKDADIRKLIELHQKYTTRKQDQIRETITSPNRFLTIIQEENSAESSSSAKNLSEWLTLARDKSKSTSNLACTNIPINNLRRFDVANHPQNTLSAQRRRSLPQEIYENQLIDIMEKEREIQRELEKLEEEKRKLRAEIAPSKQKQFQVDEFYVSKNGDFAERREHIVDGDGRKDRPVSMPVFPTEFFRQQMYEEYMDKFSEREERKQQKVIRISSSNDLDQIKTKEIVHPIEIEQEFMDKVKQKFRHDVDEGEKDKVMNDVMADETPVLVLDGDKVKGVDTLPRHLREFVGDLTMLQQDDDRDDSIWSPGQPRRPPSPTKQYQRTQSQNFQQQNDPQSPIWTPKSATTSPTVERKEFRPVNYQSPVLSRKSRTRSETIFTPDSTVSEPPWRLPEGFSDTAINLSSTLDRRLPTSQSSPGFGNPSTRLPRAQNPTITLLQKAREGQLPRGAHYITDQDRRLPNERPPIKYPGEVLYHIKNEYTSESDSEKPRKMADLSPRKFEGIGPTSKDGMPLILRSEVKEKDQSKWYKRMYDTIHKQKPHRDEYVTVRYKQKRAQYPYSSGYLSEPEPGAYDSDFTEYKYQTLDRRRTPQTVHYSSSTMPRNVSENRSYSSTDLMKNTQQKYMNQPGRIENYRPGHSSISEKEAKQWWDEVMDIFDGHLEQQSRIPPRKPRSFINQALKESGYESDSTLVFKRKEETAASQISPKEQKEAYKTIQKGGDVPFQGLRKLAPERPKETDLVEFFPISPTLTKIRIHKSIIPPSKENFLLPQQDFFCYPSTVHHSTKKFANFKPSSVEDNSIPPPPPSPPKRRSSRNNSTLRLISTMKVKTEKSPICKRHETCFTSGPSMDKTKVNYLKDKITCKLSPSPKRKMDVIKKTTASPEVKSRITSTLTTSKDPKSSTRKITSTTKISSSRGLYKSGSTGSITSKKSSTESLCAPTMKTFGTEKKKFDLNLPLLKRKTSSEELLSPTEVKKGMKNIKSSTSRKTSPKAIKKTTTEALANKKSTSINLKPNKLIKKSKKDSINDSLKQQINNSDISKQKEAIQSNHFFRNLFLRNMTHTASFPTPKNSWLLEKTNQLSRRRASVSEPNVGAMKVYLRHIRPVSDSKFISLDLIRSRSASPKSVTFSDNVETKSASKRSKSLPSKVIFSQTSRPVSPVVTRKPRSPILKQHKADNLITIRRTPSPPTKLMVFTETSRPVSPVVTKKQLIPIVKRPSSPSKKLIFTETSRPVSPVVVKRSSSPQKFTLPNPQSKLFFSETTRPISPDVRRKFTPPASPMPRSPSCRKIMQLKLHKPPEVTLYTCPELKHSNTSLDSFKSEDLFIFGDPGEKFRDLHHFYNDIEKVGRLERTFSSKPRKRCENEIIDYDRWMEVRARERAEHELKHLYTHLKHHEKEKGFLYLPKDVQRFRWKKELDRGLRIKEKSVENIKEEFERLKKEESDRENAKRREMAYSKDTYKPLWRGNSVVSLANILSERRSQSEGRVKTARQKLLDSENLLTHGIGSRIWSSLSMEQVNNLKKQLQEIYGEDQLLTIPNKEPIKAKEFIVEVPNNNKSSHHHQHQLTVRRNSESSKHDLMISEDEKKLISQTISKEVLEKINRKRREDKLALPLVIGKEMLGAMATKEAKIIQPQKPLIKTNALDILKPNSISETDSTDESTKTVINLTDEVQKKVEYFEKAKDIENYVPTVYKAAEDGSSGSHSPTEPETKLIIPQSKSCQNFKEYFGETDLVKFATLPLSATRKSDYSYTKKPHLRALDISPIRTISEANSFDSLNRSRSVSPYYEEAQALTKKGEVKKLKKQFEFFEDFFGEKKLKRSRSENDLHFGHNVDDLRKKYEYPVHSGRGRSRVRRGGMVSPIWLRAEDRYMPHINIISKIASLYSFTKNRTDKEASKSMEELAEILGCPVGEVEKMKEKFDKIRQQEDISLMGHMYTSSPNIRELRDITPYLTANWIAHKFPRSEDNTRSLSSPETSTASRDTALVRRDRPRPKQQSILKAETSPRYTKEPDLPPPPPPPPPKSQGGVRSQEPESPRKYVENEVTIHYKTPVRTEIKEYVSEDELAHRQAEAMKKIYEEEKKRKYLQVSKSMQELHDMKSRRHTDNFIPSQKSPISLNRYDDFDDLTPTKTRPRSPEPRLVAKALYNFVGQTARELTFRKGDLIYVRRQVDKNWYEGELNAMVGLFPVNYVEIVPYEGIKSTIPRKAHEGQARAKFNFVAQTHLELSLAKGELVTITRKVDDNWFEGKIGGRKGIFPVAYVDVLIDPSDPAPPSVNKPVASPAAHSLLLNGSAQGRESMGSHLYTPNVATPISSIRDNGYHHAKPVQLSGSGTYSTLPKSSKNPVEALHIETQSEPIPYRALYKYTPQNDDELELLEGDTVYVLEKCDDGWYVGSSDRTGAFGTFPGNYVEKI